MQHTTVLEGEILNVMVEKQKPGSSDPGTSGTPGSLEPPDPLGPLKRLQSKRAILAVFPK